MVLKVLTRNFLFPNTETNAFILCKNLTFWLRSLGLDRPSAYFPVLLHIVVTVIFSFVNTVLLQLWKNKMIDWLIDWLMDTPMKNKKTAKAEFPGQFDSNSIALCLSFSRIQEKIQHCSLWSDSIHIMRPTCNSANLTTNQLKFGNEVFLGISTFTYHLMPSKKISK